MDDTTDDTTFVQLLEGIVDSHWTVTIGRTWYEPDPVTVVMTRDDMSVPGEGGDVASAVTKAYETAMRRGLIGPGTLRGLEETVEPD
ncbi:MAG TPA: hypothetical protein VHC22_32630 [Pirellulales bacterium]|nr:hypothetical protein [Pirellulales bacterium]